MENNLPIMQLQAVLRRLPPSFLESDIDKCSKIEAIFLKFTDYRAHLYYYLILSADHGLQDDLLNDPVVGFLLGDVRPFQYSINWLTSSSTLIKNSKNISDMVRYGPAGITCKFLNALEQTEEDKEVLVSALPEALVTKMAYLFSRNEVDAIGQLELIFMRVIHNRLKLILPINKSTSNVVLRFKYVRTIIDALSQAIKLKYESTVAESDKMILYSLANEYCSIKQSPQVKEFNEFGDVINFLLFIIGTIFSELSVDTWLNLSEQISDNGSVQSDIGNALYGLCQLIQQHDIQITAPLKQCLNELQIAPQSDEEYMASLPWTTIQSLLKDATIEKREKLYSVLVTRSRAWKHKDGVEAIIQNLHLGCHYKVVRKCLRTIGKERCPETRQHFKSLFLTSYKHLPWNTQVELLSAVCYHTFFPYLACDNESELVLAFNRVAKDAKMNDVMGEITVLAIQNPYGAIRHTFQLSISSPENCSICAEILRHLRPMFMHGRRQTVFLDQLTDIILGKHTDKEWQSVSEFLSVMCLEVCPELVGKVVLLEIALLEDNLINHNWEQANCILTCIAGLCRPETLPLNAALLLSFILTIYVHSSITNAQSFHTDKIRLNQSCRRLQQKIDILDDEKGHLIVKSLASRTAEPVRSYFFSLWTGAESEYPDMDKLHVQLLVLARNSSQIDILSSKLDDSTVNADAFTVALIKVLPLLDSAEWASLFSKCVNFCSESNPHRFRAVFEKFATATTVFALCAEPDTFPSFEYCMNCLTEIFNSIVELDADAWLFRNILMPLNEMANEEVRDRCYLLMLPSLVKALRLCDEADLVITKYVDVNWRGRLRTAPVR